MKYNIHDAKTQFSKLVAAVEAGETVTICRNGTPVIDMVPSRQQTGQSLRGALRHMRPADADPKARIPETTPEELADWGVA